MRGAVYFDGFNLYHSINDLQKPYLKWVDLKLLAELIIRGHAKVLTRTVLCTAEMGGDTGKLARYRAYIGATKLRGVEVCLGHKGKEPMECASCGHRWDAKREKASDINLALAVYDDAIDDAFDAAFIVTADTDQAATFQAMRRRFPQKRLYTVVPPGRMPSKFLNALAYNKILLTEDHIDKCVLPGMVQKDGERTVLRPREYAPPHGWVHPSERPGRS